MIAPLLTALVGLVLEAVAVDSLGAGDTLVGFGQLLLGLAAMLASAASLVTVLMNNRKIDRGIEHVKVGTKKTEAVSKAVGSANGTSVLDGLDVMQAILDEIRSAVDEIKQFETYQHTRNHDVIGLLSELKGSILLLIELAERLLAKLREDSP